MVVYIQTISVTVAVACLPLFIWAPKAFQRKRISFKPLAAVYAIFAGACASALYTLLFLDIEKPWYLNVITAWLIPSAAFAATWYVYVIYSKKER